MDELKICDECLNEPATKYCNRCGGWLCDDCVKMHYVEKHLNKRIRKTQMM